MGCLHSAFLFDNDYNFFPSRMLAKSSWAYPLAKIMEGLVVE